MGKEHSTSQAEWHVPVTFGNHEKTEENIADASDPDRKYYSGAFDSIASAVPAKTNFLNSEPRVGMQNHLIYNKAAV